VSGDTLSDVLRTVRLKGAVFFDIDTTAPWVAETKRMHLLPKDFIKSSGWAGLLEDLCAPANELEFNRVIRDPAGTGRFERVDP
jgi:hypothetical protein